MPPILTAGDFMVAARPSAYAMNCVAMKLWNLVNSPVEHILGRALFASLSSLYEKWSCWIYSDAEFRSRSDFARSYNGCSMAIVPQFQVSDVGRLDFGIFIRNLRDEYPLVAVECDGHEFHERTPEQASNDRKRDRALASLGVQVLRFTGTDVVRRSAEVADEITAFLHAQANIAEGEWWRQMGIHTDEDWNNMVEGSFYVPYEWPRIRLSPPLHYGA
jgi:hypothetical protein